jgi:catechol 2,3-dioxygenase-like lactoylglutathione lyase family enzyme
MLRILETCLYADDLEAAERFYVDVLGLELHSREADRHVFLRSAGSMLLIFNPDRTSTAPGFVGGVRVPPHGASGPGHVAFSMADGALPAWRSALSAAGIEVEAEIEWPKGGRSIYVRDPAGNSVEVVEGEIWGLHGKAGPRERDLVNGTS